MVGEILSVLISDKQDLATLQLQNINQYYRRNKYISDYKDLPSKIAQRIRDNIGDITNYRYLFSVNKSTFWKNKHFSLYLNTDKLYLITDTAKSAMCIFYQKESY